MKQTKIIIIVGMCLMFLGAFSSRSAQAEPIPTGCPGGSQPTQPTPAECAQIPLGCPGSSQQGPIAQKPTNCPYDNVSSLDRQEFKTDCKEVDYSNCGIVRYLVDFVNVLTAITGIVIVGMIIFAGIQYSAAGDNPQAVQAARGRIINAVTALVAFIFTSAFLQWVVPGGVF